MPAEGPVVHLQPGLLVLAGPKWAGRDGRAHALDRQRSAHLVQVAATLQPDGYCDGVVVRAGLRHPDVDVPSALLGDLAQGCCHEIASQPGLGPPVGVDDVLDCPASSAAAHLRVADHPVPARSLGGDEPGKALTPSLHEVEPLVLARGHDGHQRGRPPRSVRQGCDVRFAHAALHLDFVHEPNGTGIGTLAGVPRESRASRTARALEISTTLREQYPGSAQELCALTHDGPFQLLVATILSAQCTDERVNMVTPQLFERFPDAIALASADRGELEELIKSTGFFRSKASHLLGAAAALAERHPAGFPTSMEDLTALPGVGRKTANVVRSVALGLPGLPVDTHVTRLSQRLRLTSASDPVKIETELCCNAPARGVGRDELAAHPSRPEHLRCSQA